MRILEHSFKPQNICRLCLLFAFIFLFLSNAYGQKPGSKQKDFSATGQAEVARGDLFTGPVSVTQVKHTLTIIFGNAKASLGNNMGNVNEPLNGIWVGAMRSPAEMLGGNRPAVLGHTLHGSIHKDEGAKVTVVLHFAGNTFLSSQSLTFEFPFGKKLDEDFTRDFTYKTKLKAFLTYNITAVITIERRDPKVLAEVTLDSVDVLNRQNGKPAK